LLLYFGLSLFGTAHVNDVGARERGKKEPNAEYSLKAFAELRGVGLELGFNCACEFHEYSADLSGISSKEELYGVKL
jgi:hypothetical protein